MFKTEYVEDFSVFYSEHKAHVDKHYKDFADSYGGTRQLDVDIDTYQKLIDGGFANIFTLWEDETFLGYVSVSVSPSVLCKGYVDVVVDHLYLTEEARGKGYVEKILEELEEQFKDSGVDRYTIAFPTKDSYKRLAESLGFSEQSSVYIKSLGE